jgi:hypothetical protein
MTLKSLAEKAAPALVTAAVIAAVTATYQFAQMRIEIVSLRDGQIRIENKVDALISREAHWRGSEEPEVLLRMAAQPTRHGAAPGTASASER